MSSSMNILLNTDGEELTIIADAEELTKEQIRKRFLNHVVAVHSDSYCGGSAKITKVSASKKVIFCSNCGFRVSFPSNIQTVDALEKHFSTTIT